MQNQDKYLNPSEAGDGIVGLSEYPFPIAFHLQKIAENSTPISKLKTILESYESVINYISLLLLAIYYHGEKQDDAIEAAARKLECPGAEDWFNFLKIAVRNMSGKNPLLEEIKDFYGKVEENKKIYVQEIKDYKKVNREVGLLSNFYEIRQNTAPVLTIMLEEELQAHLNFCHVSFRRILKRLDFLKRYVPYYVENGSGERKIIKKITGPDRNFQIVPGDFPVKVTPNQVFLYHADSQRLYPLHPFIVYKECYYCIREELPNTWELFLFSGRTSSRLCYHGVIHNIGMRELLAPYLQLHENKDRQIEKGDLDSIKELWERTFQLTQDRLNYLEHVKLLSHYHERKYGEALLRSFVSSSSFPAFLITGKGGIGKTTLLSAMAKRWLSHGEVVLFLETFGDRFVKVREDITSVLGGRYSWESVLKILEKNQQKLILILDQLENSTHPELLLKELSAFIETHKLQVKTILSLDDIHLRLWEKYFTPEFKKLSMPVSGNCPLIESSSFFYRLPEFKITELEGAYQTMSMDTIAPLTSFSTFSKNIKGMLRHPSVMRVFLLCLKNREVPVSIGISDILEGFVLNQINFAKNRREFLEHFIEFLLKIKDTQVTLDTLVDTADSLLINESLAPSNFSPLLELMREGILARHPLVQADKKEIYLHFPLSILREYLVYRTLALMGKHRDEILVENIKEIGGGNMAIYGVVYFALLRLANKQYFDRLVKVANDSREVKPFVRYMMYSILVFKDQTSSGRVGEGGPTDALVTAIFNSPCRETLMALADFGVYLYNEGSYLSCAYLLDKLSQVLPENEQEYDPLVISILAAYSYQKASQSKQAAKVYKKCYKMLKKIENSSREVEFYAFLGRAHRELGDKEKTEYFFKKCQELKGQIQGTMLEAELYEDFGKLAEQAGDYPKAIKYFEKQEEILAQMSNEERSGDMLENKARIHYRMGNKSECVSMLEEACEIFDEMGETRKLAFCQKKLGIVLADMSKPEEARGLLLQCVPIFESLEEQVPLAEAYLHLGRIYEQLGQEEVCREYFDKAINILRKIGDENSMAECYEKFGLIDMKKGKVDSAIAHFFRAQEIYMKNNNKVGLSNVFNHLGSAHLGKGMFAEAQKYYKDGLKLREEINDQLGIAEIYNSLSTMSAQSQQFQEALERMEKAREIYQALSNKKGLATVKSTEALIHKLQSKNSEALQAYKECAQLLVEISENSALGAIYNSIGLIYKERGDFYEALSYFEKSVKVQESVQDWSGLAASYNNIGLIYDARNEYEKALEYYTKDLKITERLGDKKGLATSYNNIAILHYNHKNYARSLWYLEKALSLYKEMDEQEMVGMLQERIEHVRKKL